MSDIFFEEMQIPKPDYNLDINSLSHGAMTGRMLEKIEEVLNKETPDYVMVYGDTNTTLAGALAAKKLHIRVVHVEAGLRSFNLKMPEEVNRVLTDRISDVLCCPTENAVQNLQREGYAHLPCTVVKTGDVMLDAAMYYSQTSAERSNVMQRLVLDKRDFVLCTIHRAENTDNQERLFSILEALNELSRTVRVVLPLHPRTLKVTRQQNMKMNFDPIGPVGYFDILELLRHSQLVMTDSGGLQKEAYFFSKPCVSLRDESEWSELVRGGYNLLVGANKDAILTGYADMKGLTIPFDTTLYGDGGAAEKIVKVLSTVTAHQ